MGIIVSLPITTTKIDELPIYGTVDADAKKKDLIEISKNSGTSSSPVYAVGGSRKIPLDEFQSLIGQAPRFFEKFDIHEFLLSSFGTGSDFDGLYEDFEITPEMHGYYLQMHLLFVSGGSNGNMIWANNRAFNIKFNGVFPDGFCIRLDLVSLGGSKTNVTDKYLTSGKIYDFVYHLETETWGVAEMVNIENPHQTILPTYEGDDNLRLILTNTNHTYIFKLIASWTATKQFILLPSNLWRGKKITIYIDDDFDSTKENSPKLYTTPYAECTGTNTYTGVFEPILTVALEGLVVWVKVANNSTGLVTIDAGFGAKKAYVDGIQANTGDILNTIIYEFKYDETLDTANGGWSFVKEIHQRDLIEDLSSWQFPFGENGVKKGSYVVFESDGHGTIKIADMNIVL